MPDLQLAAELALTCYELYRRTPAGLAPEIVHFSDNRGALGPLHSRRQDPSGWLGMNARLRLHADACTQPAAPLLVIDCLPLCALLQSCP